MTWIFQIAVVTNLGLTMFWMDQGYYPGVVLACVSAILCLRKL